MQLQTYFELKEQTKELTRHKYLFNFVSRLTEDDADAFMTKPITDSQVQRLEQIEFLTEEVQDKILQLFNHNAVTMMQISDRLRNYGEVVVKLWIEKESFNLKMVWDKEDSYYVFKNLDNIYPKDYNPMSSYIQIIEKEELDGN